MQTRTPRIHFTEGGTPCLAEETSRDLKQPNAPHTTTRHFMRSSPAMQLGTSGFQLADIHDPLRLADLTDVFWKAVASRDPALWEEFRPYLEARGVGWKEPEAAALILRMAPHLSAFVADLFRISDVWRRGVQESASLEVIFRFKKEIVSRRAARKASHAAVKDMSLELLEREAMEVQSALLLPRESAQDAEFLRARAVGELLDLEKIFDEHFSTRDPRPAGQAVFQRLEALRQALPRYAAVVEGCDEASSGRAWVARLLGVFELWAARVLSDERLRREYAASWVSFRLPEKLHFPAGLVPHEHPDPGLPELLAGRDEQLRRRDGFKLTDPRWSTREALDHAHYCVICHEREKDSCSRGFPLPRQTLEGGKNPLGIPLNGCPLEERISEMHAMARTGDLLGALAIAMIDNPMCPATGHRICNDCMKACIFQKQEPVNIPQIETRCLTSVLELPFGVEIYGLLTRWNPLNVRRPHALPYNGRNVLVVGLGPAGITLAQWLLNEGFGVVGIDGLKIEPLEPELVGANGRVPSPVRDYAEIQSQLDDRVGAGFGGVAEYGITVRWDKNFLTLLQLTLSRRERFRAYGGVRFGGTIEIDDAWDLGFDHIAIAAGAGRPTVVDMRNTLISNVRTASDFLMGLQLTGAIKKSSLANLQLQLPCIVIGSGLTAVDTATEAMAYYPVHVEKLLHRYEILVTEQGEEAFWQGFDSTEKKTLLLFLDHGRQVRKERERASQAREKPNFVPLVKAWGGVKICYRKRMVDSPAYRLNHEELIKCFEEGVEFVENLSPLEAVPDAQGAVEAMVFERMVNEKGEYRGSGQHIRLPAKSVFMAAGTTPNIIYEKEHPGTFVVDSKRRCFRPHRVSWKSGSPRLEPSSGAPGDPGFFTSYEKGGKFITFFGDNHPAYAGSVVKAMASAKDGFPEIVRLFDRHAEHDGQADSGELKRRWHALTAKFDDQVLAHVERVIRLTPTVVEVVLRAPLQAQKFRPGQFFRLQNYERTAPLILGTRLQMEGLALTGASTDREKGCLSFIILEMGASSRLCARLQPGEEVVVMGPTGAPTEIPRGELVILCGGGLGNAVLFSVAAALKASDCTVIYFAGYKKSDDLFHQAEIERGCDQVIWSVDRGEPIGPRRLQDRTFVGNIVEAMATYAKGRLDGKPLFDLREARRLISIGSDRMMAAVSKACEGALAGILHPELVAISSINSPMQCMLKEICGQCLQRHVSPEAGDAASYVFTCFNQDQQSELVDWSNLSDRLRMNSVEEKLTNLWLSHVLSAGKEKLLICPALVQ